MKKPIATKSDFLRRETRIAFSLTRDWFCAPINWSEEEIHNFLERQTTSYCDAGVPVSTDIIKERMFGGFPCVDDHNNIHFCFEAGEMTHTGINTHLKPSKRLAIWKMLIKANTGAKFKDRVYNPIKKGPFTEDMPI